MHGRDLRTADRDFLERCALAQETKALVTVTPETGDVTEVDQKATMGAKKRRSFEGLFEFRERPGTKELALLAVDQAAIMALRLDRIDVVGRKKADRVLALIGDSRGLRRRIQRWRIGEGF